MEVENIDVKGNTRHTFPGENAVEDEFSKVKERGLGTGVTGVSDVPADNEDTQSVGIRLLGFDVAEKFEDSNVCAAVRGGGGCSGGCGRCLCC